jgi:hypothetical protein
MKNAIAWLSISVAALALIPGSASAQAPRPSAPQGPTFTVTLLGRDACVTPCTHHRARADGGIIDVQVPASNTLGVTMTGTPAADSYLGCTSAVTQTFHLFQEFEVSCSDPSIREASLTLDSTLTGYVRSVRRAGACVRLASASVTPISWDGTPLAIAHPQLCVSGTEGRLCNQHLPAVQSPPMPLGRFVLVADFVLDATASGVCNAHAAADFSPDTTLPTEWVRTRDPFQGVSKKSFGFAFSVSASAPQAPTATAATTAPPTQANIRRAAFVPVPNQPFLPGVRQANPNPSR